MTDIALFNMVEQQIRPWNIDSPELLEAIYRLDRTPFVPETKLAFCYFDMPIELGDGSMLPPKLAARLVQAMEIQPSDHVLVVGAGSGYTAALCAELAGTVVCHDSDQAALDRAAANCAAAGVDNIGFQKVGENLSPTDKVRYDAILFRDSRPEVPDAYLKKLDEAGRCVVQIGTRDVLELMRYRREGDEYQQDSIVDILSSVDKTADASAGRATEFVF